MINWLKGKGQCQRINGCGKTDDHIVGELGQAKYQMKGLGMEAEGGLYGGMKEMGRRRVEIKKLGCYK